MICVLNLYLSMSCVLAHIVLLPHFTSISYEPLVSPFALHSHLWMQDVDLVDISMTLFALFVSCLYEPSSLKISLSFTYSRLLSSITKKGEIESI